jgi:hypothetical protein
MRPLRIAFATALAVASLAVPAVAAADPTVSVLPTGELGPEGATAVVFVSASCDPGASSLSISVSVAQSSGRRLIQGSGSVGFMFGTVPLVCDGTSQLVPITVAPNVFGVANPAPLKSGKAAASASMSEFGPSGYVTVSDGPEEISLKK